MVGKWICVAVAVTLGNLGAAEKPDVFRDLAAGKKETVVVYGTSLSHGGEWAKETKKWFDAKYPGQVSFVNNSGPGQHSGWGLQHVEEKVVKLQPGLVLVEFAFNDARDKYDVSVRQAAGNLEKIVAVIRKGSPRTEIVLQVMNVGWDVPDGNQSDSWRPKLQDYNDNYRKMAKSQGFDLIDHYAAWEKLKKDDFETYKKYIPDGTHPDAAGSLAVTWPGVKAWLEKRSGK
jgi:acyl-CoA thioesterase-1